MLAGGIAELIFGVRAEQRSLENIARPLTAQEAEAETPQAQAAVRQAERERNLSPEDRRRAGERDRRVRERADHRHRREVEGVNRYLLGPGRTSAYSPGMMGTAGTASRWSAVSDQELDREIDEVSREIVRDGTVDRQELAERVGARAWGPRRFSHALAEAISEGRARRLTHNTYGTGATAERERDE